MDFDLYDDIFVSDEPTEKERALMDENEALTVSLAVSRNEEQITF